jgi:hypothetical protein
VVSFINWPEEGRFDLICAELPPAMRQVIRGRARLFVADATVGNTQKRGRRPDKDFLLTGRR